MESSEAARANRKWRRRRLRRSVQLLDAWLEGVGDDTLKGVRSCGHAAGADVGVWVASDRSEVRESGVWSCNRVWLCAVCSAKIRAQRAGELDYAAELHRSRGGELVMVTLTVRHSAELPLAESLAALQGAWAALRGRSAHRGVTRRCEGLVKATEVTLGPNGWHPHLHVLYFVKPGELAAVLGLLETARAAWAGLVRERLGIAPTEAHGVDVRVLHGAAAYLSKVGPELAMADTKGQKTSPFSLLELAESGELSARERWLEYALAMHGKASLFWSPGLREHFGLSREMNEGVAAVDDEVPVDFELVALIPRNTHRWLVCSGAIDSVLERLRLGWYVAEWLPAEGVVAAIARGSPARPTPRANRATEAATR